MLCLDVVGRLPEIYDEPFGDISQVPTFLVAQMASQQVKVVLSGDGGDETFSGYKHYPEGLAQWRWLAKVPHGLRAAAADSLSLIGDQAWQFFRTRDTQSGRKLPGWKKFAGKLDRKTRNWRSATSQAVLANHFSRTHRPESIVIGAAQI